MFLALLAGFSALGQKKKTPSRVGSSIVNDSSKSVYGPKTTLWTTEKDLFQNRPNYRPLDTTIHNYHHWTYVSFFNNYYKDLGVMGTALNSIFPNVPAGVGASSGFQAYEPYFATEEPHYFDTKSPFTRMFVVWGGLGRAKTRVEFSRNINPRWNIGFDYRPILVDKQIQSTGKGDRQTVSHYYDFYTTYKTKNERYFALVNYRRIRHRVTETGGVSVQPNDPYTKLFEVNASPNLTKAKTEEYRRNIHFFHQYKLANPIQIYHIADFTKQDNVLTDYPTQETRYKFDHNEPVSKDTTFDKTIFTTMQQEVGVKGNAAKLFYSAYVKLRTFSYYNMYLVDSIVSPVPKSGVERYVGGQISLKLDSLSEISGSAEYLLGGYYRIEGQIQTPWIEGYFKNSYSKPGFMQMLYRGAHDYWNNPFVGLHSTQAQAFLKLNTNAVQVKAGGTFTLLNNYIYFKEVIPMDTVNGQKVLPYQSAGNQSVASPEVRASFRFLKHLYFRPQAIYSVFLTNDDNALRIPQLFINGQFTFESSLFKNHIQVQTGVELHWKSAYTATGYDPVIQTFYVQDKTISPVFPLVDVFFIGKMRRARFFVTFHNLLMAIAKPNTCFSISRRVENQIQNLWYFVDLDSQVLVGNHKVGL